MWTTSAASESVALKVAGIKGVKWEPNQGTTKNIVGMQWEYAYQVPYSPIVFPYASFPIRGPQYRPPTLNPRVLIIETPNPNKVYTPNFWKKKHMLLRFPASGPTV